MPAPVAAPSVVAPSVVPPLAVPSVARRQAGVFTREQALAEGWTPRQVERRRERRRWNRVVGPVLTADPGPPSAAALAWAVHLLWPDAVVALRTAAQLWRLPVRDDGLAHVLTTVPGRRASGARVRTGPVGALAVWQGSVLVTSRTRTVLDCLALLPDDESLDLYAWATTRGLVTRDDVAAELRDRFGRPGAGRLRRLLALTRTGAVSSAEVLLHRLLRRAGVTGWRAGAEVHDEAGPVGVVDLLFETARVVVEVDGERAHSGRTAFVADRRRQNRLVNAGYRVLRFTWWDLTERPAAVVAEIRAALAG